MSEWWIDRWKIGRWSVAYLLTLCGLFVLMLYGLVQCASNSSDAPKNPATSTRTKQIEAVIYCKELVNNSLKAPSTADFPWAIEAKNMGDIYTVDSYVDAQNSFGALIRTYFSCQLKYVGESANKWRVSDFRVYQ